jgi:HSP90 family molecular chaperone
MLGLPKTTEFNKRIPKQKFYENIEISPALKKVFVDQVKTIYWKNKIAATTVNLSPGTDVTEIEVFEVKLNSQTLDERMLRQMDKEIPYHILFLLEYQGKYQAWIGYKEAASSGSSVFKVSKYYHTDWLDETELPVKLEGMNIDTVYENFVRQIAGDKLQDAPTETLKDSVEKAERKATLKKQITALQAKIRKEKQLNRQVEMNTELKKLKKELANIG